MAADPDDKPILTHLEEQLQQLDPAERRAFIENNIQSAKERASDYVDRRSVLKAAGTGAGLGLSLGVGYNEGVQQAKAAASTSDGDGDVGTPSNPVDVFADGVDAVSVGADEANIGTSPQRPVKSDAVQTITVGTDAATLQEAFDMAAMLPHHAITIDIPDGDYTTEDPVLRTVAGGSIKNGDSVTVTIDGNTTTPSNVKLGSLTVDGVQGWAKVRGMRLTDASPHDNEGTNFAAYNSTHVSLAHVDYNDPNGNAGVGVTAYNSNVELAINNRFADTLDRGTKNKHRGVIWEQHSSGGTPVTDQGNGGPFTAMHRAQNGIIAVDSTDSNIVSRDGEPVEVAHGGMLIDMATNSIIDDSLTQRFRGLRATQPSPLVSKGFYLDDGTNRTAGWYITTDGGTNWTAV